MMTKQNISSLMPVRICVERYKFTNTEDVFDIRYQTAIIMGCDVKGLTDRYSVEMEILRTLTTLVNRKINASNILADNLAANPLQLHTFNSSPRGIFQIMQEQNEMLVELNTYSINDSNTLEMHLVDISDNWSYKDSVITNIRLSLYKASNAYNNNILEQAAQSMLGEQQALSTSLKINSAADDSTGLAISEHTSKLTFDYTGKTENAMLIAIYDAMYDSFVGGDVASENLPMANDMITENTIPADSVIRDVDIA